uniref:Uncharacterized protein n=1 Tax=Parascaris equorum TaxID=6256 RepID=A0A914R791_PAREQ
MPVGTEVIALQAFDPDDPDAAVKYAIVDGDGMGYFTVDPAGLFFFLFPPECFPYESHFAVVNTPNPADPYTGFFRA